MTNVLPLPTVMAEHSFAAGTIRVLDDTAGQRWFLALDLLRAIGYGVAPDTGKVKQGSVITNMPDEHKRLISVPCGRGRVEGRPRWNQPTTVLSPDGLTLLLTRSLKPGAKPLLRFAERAGWVKATAPVRKRRRARQAA